MSRSFNPPQVSSKELACLLFGIIILAFIFFGNGIKGQFVYDDVWVVNLNPAIQQISQVFKQFISPYHYLQPETGLYRPLTIVSYTFNFLFGKGPAGFHVINILLHSLNVFLVFLLVFKLFSSKRLAYLASVLFFFLPIHIEAVTSISGRSDLLAFFFALIALLLFLNNKYWPGSAAFLLSMLSKESAVLFVPLVFAFWLWIYKKEGIARIVKGAIYFVPPAVIYGLLRYVALKEHFLSASTAYIFNPLVSADIFSRFYTAFKVMMLYLWKTFVPLHLSADYSFNQIPVIRSALNSYAAAGLLVLLAATIVIFWKKTKTSPLAFGLVLFLSSYFVVSNFIFPIGTIMAERIFYLPSLGIVLIAALALDKLMSWKLRKFWLAMLILACLFYGIIIINRNTIWANEESLYTDMIKESPNSSQAKAVLGILYLKNNKWGEGKKLLEESYRITPDRLSALDGLGLVAEHEGRYKDAESFYLKALQVNPNYSTTLSNLGRMYYQLGMYKKSADLSLRWVSGKLNPAVPELWLYAMSVSRLGQYNNAIAVIAKYYGENPADINLKLALGYAYYKKGDRAIADKYFKESKNPAMSDEELIKSIERF